MDDSYLVVCDFSGGVSNTGKLERHIGPLADQAETTVVCITPDENLDAIDYRCVPSTGVRVLDLVTLFVLAVVEGVRNEYDGVISVSLFPYGCFALALGRLFDLPTHLGIIGADLDLHAEAWYGAFVATLFRRFDAITVPGTTHRRQLEQFGVPGERIRVLANGVDLGVYRPNDPPTETEYDYLWVGRFTPEKDPLLFVETIAELDRRGERPRAAMLGRGPLKDEVTERIRAAGIEDRIDRPGWVDEPVAYYRRSATFVLTSERDALPLALLEAMATGLACVVPEVGNVRDVVVDGETGLVADSRDPAALADALQRLDDVDLHDRLSTAAPDASTRFSIKRAAEDWAAVRRTLQAN